MSPYEIFPESTKSILLAFANPQTACILSGPAHENSKKSNFFLAAGKNCRGAIGILTSGTGDTKTLPKFPVLCAAHVYSREGTFWTACRVFFCFGLFTQPMCPLANVVSGLRVRFFFSLGLFTQPMYTLASVFSGLRVRFVFSFELFTQSVLG